MHLRSVEIQGFKTFAKKTELYLEPGITAVVGPNGSGKSNLVDAIRWVLGERSARELRGTRMEEVVYSGGARRAASGMAEVRMVIDNADGRLAVPYAEVEVMRRGYRSGESEYWLNGARCRLRDIEELFASTGLTQEGYSVVAQDDVDHIIQTSAAERRALIEEAAGVRGLRHKRDEALAKIRESEITVLRLQDLAAELGPRVEELRRQAEAARGEAELQARLENLRGSLLRGEWLAARQRARKAAARVGTLELAVADARSEAAAAAAAHANQRERLAQAHDARLARERQLGALRLEATSAQSRVQLLEERLSVMKKAKAEAEAEVVAAHARLEQLKAELATARDEAAAATAPPGAPHSNPELDAARDTAGRAREARESLEHEAAEAREAAARAEAALAALESRRQGSEASGAELGVELAQAEAELRAAQAEDEEVKPAEERAREASGLLESSLRAQTDAEAALDRVLAAEREASSAVERLEERRRALRSLAADGDLPAPSAARLVELLQHPGVRAAAIAAGIAERTLDAWIEEGRGEERAIARALEQCEADLEAAAARVAAATAAAQTGRTALERARAEVDARREAHLGALGAVAAAAARDSARRQRLEAAGHRAERLRAALAERVQEPRRLDAAIETAAAEVREARSRREAIEAPLAAATAEEADAAARFEALQRAEDQAAGRRAELAARADALAARRQRAEAAVTAQVTEVGRARQRSEDLGASLGALEAEHEVARAAHAAALAALEASPEGAVPEEELAELTEHLLAVEKEHLERQVALAHHEDALAAAREAHAAEEATVGDLAARMGDAGEAETGDDFDWEKTQREITRVERQLAHLGPVNPLAIEEYERDNARFSAIDGQLDDLVQTRDGLLKVADELTGEIDRRFEAVFGAVAFNFQETFGTLFVNGKATLKLDDPAADEPGVEILAQPAGKRMRGIRLLSGGERALTALAFILALEKVNPSPFYIFDEVDAPLDDANVKRFNAMLQSMAAENQFILVTHNHQTMTSAQALYGVTLEDSGVSRVVSVRLREGQVVALPARSSG